MLLELLLLSWTPDNHLLRRVSIPAGVVSTVAGRPDVGGYADEVGTFALFSSL